VATLRAEVERVKGELKYADELLRAASDEKQQLTTALIAANADLAASQQELEKVKGELADRDCDTCDCGTCQVRADLAASQQQVADWQNKWLGENAAWKAMTLDYQASQQRVNELEQQNKKLREALCKICEITYQVETENLLYLLGSAEDIQKIARAALSVSPKPTSGTCQPDPGHGQ
jgi:predicted  nucleic acid-binding Zn-ribbon protein